MTYKDPQEQREYQRAWIAKRRADWFQGKSCVGCGSENELELDHVDSSTKISHRVWSWSKARRDQELEKCVVRCRECHIDKSREFDWKKCDHGSASMYQYHKCRCDLCRAWKYEERFGYEQRKKLRISGV